MSRARLDSYERRLAALQSRRNGQSSATGSSVRSRSRSPISYRCSSKEEQEWLDYQLAKRLQEEAVLEPRPLEDTLDEEQLERILGSSFASYPRRNRARVDSASAAPNIPTVQSTNHLAQQPLRRGDEEMYADELTLLSEGASGDEDVEDEDLNDDDDDDDDSVDLDTSHEEEERENDDDDDYEGDGSVDSDRSDGTRSAGEELQSSNREEETDDNDDDDSEENEDNATPSERTRYSVGSNDTETLFDTIDILENLSRQVLRPLAVLASLTGFDDEEDERSSESMEVFTSEEPDDTVIRSDAFGRCTICFEEVPYDPVGCLYCQQLIGCRRCVNRWYEAAGRRNNDFDLLGGHPPVNHKKCPLCRHIWEDQVEVTSMFLLRDDFP